MAPLQKRGVEHLQGETVRKIRTEGRVLVVYFESGFELHIPGGTERGVLVVHPIGRNDARVAEPI
jgi:hypothetical protein